MTDEAIRRHNDLMRQIEFMRALDRKTMHLPIETVERLMSTGHKVKVGRVDPKKLAKGKIEPKPAHMSVPKKVAAKAKADRVDKRLRANRKGKA